MNYTFMGSQVGVFPISNVDNGSEYISYRLATDTLCNEWVLW